MSLTLRWWSKLVASSRLTRAPGHTLSAEQIQLTPIIFDSQLYPLLRYTIMCGILFCCEENQLAPDNAYNDFLQVYNRLKQANAARGIVTNTPTLQYVR